MIDVDIHMNAYTHTQSKYLNQGDVCTGVIGTPAYMAPEVIADKPYDAKADVFGFAIILSEMLTGEYPYDDFRASEIPDTDRYGWMCLCISVAGVLFMRYTHYPPPHATAAGTTPSSTNTSAPLCPSAHPRPWPS
jgi:serine/threonine protein kinase